MAGPNDAMRSSRGGMAAARKKWPEAMRFQFAPLVEAGRSHLPVRRMIALVSVFEMLSRET